MNNNNGALSFEADFNNEKFNGAVEEAKRRVQGFSAATVKEGEKIDDVFKLSTENIRIQKDVIAKIEGQIKHLNTEIGKTAPGMAQNDLRKQAAQLTAELNGEKAALTMLEQQVKETEVSHVSFRTQLRNVREELIAMEQAGLRGTDAYDALQAKAGQLNDAYKDAQQQMTVLANDERGFQGVVSMMSGVTGAFSAAQGAVGLFSGENENLNRIMLKVQSLMAITIGLQQVSQTLNKDSYFSVVLLTKAKSLLAIAETKLAAAFGISTAAARVFMATVTLGLSAAITGAIVLVSKFVSKQRELSKEQEKFNSAVADTVSKPIVQVERLSIAWSKLGDDIKAKEKFLKDHADTFKDLGTNVKSVADAENLLIKNKDAFILAQIAKAKALAATDKAVELAKEQYAVQAKMETTAKTKKVINYNTGVTEEYENSEYRKLKKRNEKLQEDLKKLYGDAANYELQAIETLVTAGIDAVGDNIDDNIKDLVEGSIAYYENLIRVKQEALQKATNPADHAKIEAEINKLRTKIDTISGKDPEFAAFKNKLSEQKTLFQKYEDAKKVYGEKKAKEMYAVMAESYKEYLIKLRSEVQNSAKYTNAVNEALMPIFNDEHLTEIPRIKAFWEQQLNHNKTLIKQMRDLKKAEDDADKQKELDLSIKTYEQYNKTLETAYLLTDALGEMGDVGADMAANLQKAFNTISNIASSKSGYEALAKGVMAVISVFIDRANDRKNAAAEAELARLTARFEALRNEVELLNYAVGAEKIENYIRALADYQSQIEELWNKRIPTEVGKISFDSSGIKDFQEQVTALQNWYNALKEWDASESQLSVSESTYADLEALMTMLKEYQDLLNEFYSQQLGFTKDSVVDEIRQGFEQGYSSVQDFAEFTSSTIRKALMQSFQAKYLDSQLQDWFNSFGSAVSDGALSESELKKYKTALEGVINNSSLAFEEYKKMIDELGVSSADSSSKSALTGNIKGVSEATASALGGQINAIRINQAESLAVIRNQLMYLSNIDRNTKYLELLPQVVTLLGGAATMSETAERSRGLMI